LRLLLDEMYPQRIATELRKRHHDVVAVVERPELRASEDAELLVAATSEGRVVVTEDVVDFLEVVEVLASEGPSDLGVILVPASTFPRSDRGYGALIRALDAYLREHEGEVAVPGQVHWLGAEGVTAILEEIPGAWERAQLGKTQGRQRRTVRLKDL
jgi:hypothetical protein